MERDTQSSSDNIDIKGDDDKGGLEDRENNGHISNNLFTTNEMEVNASNGPGDHKDEDFDNKRKNILEEREEISKKDKEETSIKHENCRST